MECRIKAELEGIKNDLEVAGRSNRELMLLMGQLMSEITTFLGKMPPRYCFGIMNL